MKKIAKFEKVSKKAFVTELLKSQMGILNADQKEAIRLYEGIVLPKRATTGSAGYDIFTPFDIKLRPRESMLIPTGIRVKIRGDYCLLILPRSSLGSRFRFQLNNTVGVIDSDYYFSDNEGQILVPMINDSHEGKDIEVKAGCAFVQGIFVNYGITVDDEVLTERNGGFGSTD